MDIGGVDEIDAGVERLADHSFGFDLLQVADLGPQAFAAAERHRAEGELGYVKARAAEGPENAKA